MNKILMGCLLLGAVLVGLNPFLAGCGSSSTAPVTVTQQAAPCAGVVGYAYITGANAGTQNKILAEGVSIATSNAVTAKSLGFYIFNTSTAGQIRGAIYAGSSSGPTTLLAESAPQSAVFDEWNEVPIPSTVLSSGGFYWLAIQGQNATYCGSDITGTSGYQFLTTSTYVFGAFPSSMPVGGAIGNIPLMFYANTCP